MVRMITGLCHQRSPRVRSTYCTDVGYECLVDSCIKVLALTDRAYLAVKGANQL